MIKIGRATKLAGGCLVATLAFVAMHKGAHAQDWDGGASDYQQQIERGAKAWAENCDRCHNMRPIGDLRPEEWFVVVQHMRVRAGLPGALADDIRAFLTSSSGGAAVAPGAAAAPAPVTGAGDSTGAAVAEQTADAAAGQIVFNGTCVGCHGSNGAGALPGVPDLRQRLGKSDQTLINNIINGVQTGQLAMPPRGGNPNLTNADIANVVAYMKQSFR